MKPLASMTLGEAEAYWHGFNTGITSAAITLDARGFRAEAEMVFELLRKPPPTDKHEPWETQKEYCS